jgi:hypothetical protein
MEEAKRIYHLRGLPSLFVNVHFELRFDCRQSDVHAFGETLANEKR